MIERYEDPAIAQIWSDQNKLEKWQRVELAAIRARCFSFSGLPEGVIGKIITCLESQPVDITRWKALEKELHHDLNAFVYERQEKLTEELRRYFHDGLTSYDTEEPAFALMLGVSVDTVASKLSKLLDQLVVLAKKYRYTIMNGRTHGQEAELQSFGKRVLTWLVQIRLAADRFRLQNSKISQSKLSGAIGNYGGIDPELEEKALEILGLKPFYGATQIMPREIYLPVAEALCQITQTCDKIATDIRLMARSGLPLVQEPFGKKQTGSSAMPHKKNTISTEKIGGMARLAIGYLEAIRLNISTWEERAIEQSSCERVAWPDLFHVTTHAVDTLTKVLKGLRVYPDNMLREIVNSRGCYAAAQAKDFLKAKGAEFGLSSDDAYRIVQLAAFNAFAPDERSLKLREKPAESFEEAFSNLNELYFGREFERCDSIQNIIYEADLRMSSELAATQEEVERWNKILKKMFSDVAIRDGWGEVFNPSNLLKNEDFLFKKILGS